MISDQLCCTCVTCNWEIPFVEALNGDELNLINGSCFPAKYEKGQVILDSKSNSDSYLLILDGVTRICVEGISNRRLILNYLKTCEMSRREDISNIGLNEFWVEAVVDTYVCFISIKSIEKLLASNEVFRDNVLKLCSFNYNFMLDRMVVLNTQNRKERLAGSLVYLSEKVFESNTIPGEIPRQELADFTSMSKDSVIRILGEFETDNLIQISGRKIHIKSKKRLLEMA